MNGSEALPVGRGCSLDTEVTLEHSERLQRASDKFYYVKHVLDETIVNHIRDDNADILIDLMSHTTSEGAVGWLLLGCC